MSYRSWGCIHDKPVTAQSLLNESLEQAINKLNNKADAAAKALVEREQEKDRDTIEYLKVRYGDKPWLNHPDSSSEVGRMEAAAREPFDKQRESLMAAYEKASIELGLGRGKADEKLAIIESFRTELKRLLEPERELAEVA